MTCNPIKTFWRFISRKPHPKPDNDQKPNTGYEEAASQDESQTGASQQDAQPETNPSRPSRLEIDGIPRPALRTVETDLTILTPSEDRPRLRKLQEDLKERRLKSRPARAQAFVPRGDLQRLVNEDLEAVLQEILERSTVEFGNISSFRRLISQQAMCLFAILVDTKKENHIIEFLSEGIQDDNLPFVKPAKSERSCSALVTRQKACIDTLKNWDSQSIDALETKQYRMLSPVFRRGEHYDLDDLDVLPFIDQDIELDYTPHAAGGFGEVSRECIHPDHHDFEHPAAGKGLIVAVKRMFFQDDFEPERKVYRDLGHSSHCHLIDLLFTYKKGTKNHFVFPWADGSLKDYWERYPHPKCSPDLLLWSVEQMVGIADGLAYFHQFTNPDLGQTRFGRHGDIKATNILWFGKENVLKMADLGLASVRGKGSRSNVPPNSVVVSPTYSPPEVGRNHSISRKWDIWSLGCLYLEHISYLVRGCAAIAEFSRFRSDNDDYPELFTDTFYTTNFESVKPSVALWVHRLKRESHCSKMLCDILDLIMREMIVIDPDARSTSRKIHKSLGMILKHAREDSDYLLEPDPTARRAPSPRAPRVSFINTPSPRRASLPLAQVARSRTWNI